LNLEPYTGTSLPAGGREKGQRIKDKGQSKKEKVQVQDKGSVQVSRDCKDFFIFYPDS
jgi:hypothetical protein